MTVRGTRVVTLLVILTSVIVEGCGGFKAGGVTVTTSTSQFAQCINITPAELSQQKQAFRGQIASYSATISQMDKNKKAEIEIFIKTNASQRDIKMLGDQIKAMSEVKSLEFVSKEEALKKLQQILQGHEDILNSFEENTLPASYILTLYESTQVKDVASRFFDNPLVDNSPGTHDGVKYSGESREQMEDLVEMMQDYLENAHSCESPRGTLSDS